MKQEKIIKILNEIYTKVYAVSIPSADFMELCNNAEINKDGKKVIKYDDYQCEEHVVIDIINKTLSKYKIPIYQRQHWINTLYLGVLPKFKRET